MKPRAMVNRWWLAALALGALCWLALAWVVMQIV